MMKHPLWHENHVTYLRENYPWMNLQDLAEGLAKVEPKLPRQYAAESLRVYASFYGVKRLPKAERIKRTGEVKDKPHYETMRITKPSPWVTVHRCL